MFTLTVKETGNLTNAAGTSLPSTDTSPPLVGDFGTLEGPSIVSITADDPDDGDSVYSDGDTITVVFSGATNQPPVSTKADLDALILTAKPERKVVKKRKDYSFSLRFSAQNFAY